MKIKEGDVFTIPVNKQFNGIGQVIKIPIEDCLLIVVYEQLVTIKETTPDIVDKLSPFLIGNTVDALFFKKKWKIIGNYTINIKKIVLPIYRLGDTDDEMFITDHIGEIIRKATRAEFEALDDLSAISPITFELALCSHHGVGEWDENDDELLYTKAIKNAKLIKKDK